MSTTVTSKEDETLARLLRHMQAVREHFPSVAYMKDALVKDDKFMFMEAWAELSNEVKTALWVAPKYGGVWTTRERETIREWDNERSDRSVMQKASAYARAHEDEYKNRLGLAGITDRRAIMKYRKKPVVIDAIRWTGDTAAVKDFLRIVDSHPGCELRYKTDNSLTIKTLEGVMLADLGDWIIRGVKGELYPCKPDIFEATYESA